MNLSLGYFTYDMLCCLYIDLDFANVVHHLCTMLGLAVGVCNGVVSSTPCCCCFKPWLIAKCPKVADEGVQCRVEQN